MNDRRPRASAADDLVVEYHDWLVTERGLAASTVRNYLRDARQFLAEQDGRDLADLALSDVSSFMVHECARRTSGSAKRLACGLRSLMRYLHLAGITERELAQAVPAPKHWRGGWLPRGFSAEEVAALVTSSDRDSALGRRDHAIVVILARLGLRAAEVAALSLDDLDWVGGEITVHGKGNRTERLPLPVDVGEALVAHLEQGRPQADCRAFFLRAAGPKGARHRRRCQMWCAEGVCGPGWHLEERIGCATVPLPHWCAPADHWMRSARFCASTPASHRPHAKVDFARLGELAQPWPEGLS